MLCVLLIALKFITITTLDGVTISINVDEIVSIRDMRGPEKRQLHQDVNCTIYTVDGKFLPTKETCEQIREKIAETENQ